MLAINSSAPDFKVTKFEPIKRGRGRPKGSKDMVTKSAREHLRTLGFDPLEHHVKLYWHLTGKLNEMQFHPDGTPKERVNQLAVVGVYNLLQKITADLLRYGWARMPEITEIKSTSTAPVQIVLTKDGYNPPSELEMKQAEEEMNEAIEIEATEIIDEETRDEFKESSEAL